MEKLFDAALHEREAPSRFGTPIDQRKSGPAAFQKADQAAEPTASPFKADTSEAKPFAPFVASPFQAAPSVDSAAPEVVLDNKAVASLDQSVNAELEAILDKKITAEKRKKRRDRLMVFGLLIGALGGSAGWLVANPAKMQSIKDVIAEIVSTADPNAVADKYKKSLEKVAVRGDQLSEASAMIGGKVVEGEDQSMGKEMKEVAGENAGLSPGERQKKLKEKFDSLPKK